MKDDASPRPVSRTLGDLVDEMAARRPTAEAIVFRDERLDYAALKARADAFARALLAVGVRHGDRVALLVTNRPEWIICSLAAAKMGAIVAAISTFSTPRELAWALEHCGAVALITLEAFRGRRFLDALRDLCPELGDRATRGAEERAAPVFAHSSGGRRSGACRRLFAARIPGAGSVGESGITCCYPADGEARRHLLHPLYLGLDCGAQGRNARPWRRHRQRL